MSQHPRPGRRPRVLFVEYGMGFGGSVISLSELVEGLHQLGEIEATVLTFQEPAIIEGLFPHAKLIRIRRLLSYRTRDLYLNRVQRYALLRRTRLLWTKLYALADTLHDLVLSLRLFRLVKQEDVDIVHMNNGWEISAARAARWSGARVVVHARGFIGKGLPPANPAAVPGSWGQECYLSISDAVSSDLRAFGVPAGNVHTIYNPVSVGAYLDAAAAREAVRVEWGVAANKIVAAVFGRVVPWKGQLEFLQAMAPILDECPHLLFMIVGDASDSADAYLRTVRALAEAYPLRGRVIFTGYQREVNKYFAAADIVVHCSSAPEPFGRVVMEGMASGRAVIAMDEGGPPEIITHGQDGLLVTPRDALSMQQAVRSLYASRDLRERLGRRARATVLRRFAPEVIAAQVATCYRHLLPTLDETGV